MAVQDADLNDRQFRKANPISGIFGGLGIGPKTHFPNIPTYRLGSGPNPVLLSQMLDNGFIDFIIVFFQDRDKLCCNIFN